MKYSLPPSQITHRFYKAASGAIGIQFMSLSKVMIKEGITHVAWCLRIFIVMRASHEFHKGLHIPMPSWHPASNVPGTLSRPDGEAETSNCIYVVDSRLWDSVFRVR